MWKLWPHWCGDDHCNCHYVQIRDCSSKKVFESSWFDGNSMEDLEECRKETREFCDEHNIKVCLVGCIWDWDILGDNR